MIGVLVDGSRPLYSERRPGQIMNSFLRQILIICVAAFVALPAAAQLTGRQAMLEGNALFRSGLYRAALLRYREAAATGADSPLLAYNLGVTYAKLGQLDEAASYLRQAASDAALAPLAAYNLGLVHRAAGERDAAAAEFRRAAGLARDRSFRRLAQNAADAAESADNGRDADDSGSEGAARRSRVFERRAGDLRVLALARFGQNDNVYEAPSDPYVDLSDPAQPIVVPVVRSSSFMPVDVLAEYVLPNEAGDTDFIFAYRLDGDFYDAEFSNANRVSQRFSIGADIVLGERENRRRTLSSDFFLRGHEETNFNPDDGIDRAINGEDVSDRFRYRAAGAEIEYGQAIGRWNWGFDLSFERRQYEDVPLVESFDHNYYLTRLKAGHDFNDRTHLTLGLRQYRRVYDERLARDLNGALLGTNPTLEYGYTGVQLGLVRDLSRTLELSVDYMRLERSDRYVGYYDYTQDVVRLGADYRPNSRFELSVSVLARRYDYPNAFAFNEPTAGPRELETSGGELQAEYRITSGISIWAAVEIEDVASSDPRSAFGQTLSTLGIMWRR